MAIRVMTKVWDEGPDDRTETIVLLCLADHANDDGKCYPSITRIAERCRLSRQGTMNALGRLEDDGWITKHSGGGRGNPNHYTIHLGRFDKGSSSLDGKEDLKGQADKEKGQADKEKGQADKDKGSSSLDGNRQEPANNRKGSARTREGGDEQGEEKNQDRTRDEDPPGVEVWVDVTGERPNIATRGNLQAAFTREDAPRWDEDTFRDVLREAYQNVDRDAHRVRIGYLMSSYQRALPEGKNGQDVEYNARGYQIQ